MWGEIKRIDKRIGKLCLKRDELWRARTFMAQGARFLKDRPWTRLWRWMVYSRVTTSPNALRLPVYLRGCGVSLTIEGRGGEGRGENDEIDGPSACLSSRRGTVEIIQNSISTRGLWNNGHELSLWRRGVRYHFSVARLDCCQAQTMLKRLTFLWTDRRHER